MKKLFVIKNIKTKKYYTGEDTDYPCTAKDIARAEIFDEKWVKEEYEFLGGTLRKNEKFVEIEIKEKKSK